MYFLKGTTSKATYEGIAVCIKFTYRINNLKHKKC